MNDEQLRSLLTRAKAYQSKQVAEAEHHLEEARQKVREAEVRLATWTTMAPFEIEKELAEDLRLQKAAEEAQSQKDYLEARHAAALRQAHEYGKGILPPQQFGSKHVSFAAIGSVVGALFAMYISSTQFDLDSDLILYLAGLVGGLIGLYGGSTLVHSNFVEDQSLDRGPFAETAWRTARAGMRRTYFKGSRD